MLYSVLPAIDATTGVCVVRATVPDPTVVPLESTTVARVAHQRGGEKTSIRRTLPRSRQLARHNCVTCPKSALDLTGRLSGLRRRCGL